VVPEIQKSRYAPLALFVYNRPWHTRQTVEALLASPIATESHLYVFSDAPRNEAASHMVGEIRSYISSLAGFKSITIVERETNLGLAQSIIDGVTRLCAEYGRVIVLEDDLVTSPHFLQYLNDGLDVYKDVEQVVSIHGYVYPLKATLPETFFLRGADCWGWATWKRGWDLFEPDSQILLRELTERKLTHSFDFDGTYPYTKMLKYQMKGKNNSWAIRWYASAFLRNKLTLYPGRSLVLNIGMDKSGTHCSTTSDFAGDMADSPVRIESIPVVEHLFARQQYITFHKAIRPSVPIRILRKLTSIARHAI
jgi:hypothetical protein